MNELEKYMQHEIIKKLMKQAIDDNPFLNSIQNEQQNTRRFLCGAG